MADPFFREQLDKIKKDQDDRKTPTKPALTQEILIAYKHNNVHEKYRNTDEDSITCTGCKIKMIRGYTRCATEGCKAKWSMIGACPATEFLFDTGTLATEDRKRAEGSSQEIRRKGKQLRTDTAQATATSEPSQVLTLMVSDATPSAVAAKDTAALYVTRRDNARDERQAANKLRTHTNLWDTNQWYRLRSSGLGMIRESLQEIYTKPWTANDAQAEPPKVPEAQIGKCRRLYTRSKAAWPLLTQDQLEKCKEKYKGGK